MLFPCSREARLREPLAIKRQPRRNGPGIQISFGLDLRRHDHLLSKQLPDLPLVVRLSVELKDGVAVRQKLLRHIRQRDWRACRLNEPNGIETPVIRHTLHLGVQHVGKGRECEVTRKPCRQALGLYSFERPLNLLALASR